MKYIIKWQRTLGYSEEKIKGLLNYEEDKK